MYVCMYVCQVHGKYGLLLWLSRLFIVYCTIIRLLTLVQGGKRIVDVSAGSTHAAVIDEDGQIYTWGEGGSWWKGGGQLGHGVRANEPTPR